MPPRKPARRKYGAIRTEVDGIMFASKMESRRYIELKQMEKHGAIRNLELQPRYRLDVNGLKICDYVGDFRYWDNQEKRKIVEDVKGTRTSTYIIKRKLMKAIHGVDILETKA